MAVTYKVLSALLSYPDAPLQQAAPELIRALDDERLLSGVHRDALIKLVAEIAGGDLIDVQAQYVDLFDRTRSLSLHLFEHVHGESRDRGQAMVSLRERYRQSGFDIAANELPDYLPLFLEFVSLLPANEARSTLSQIAHILEAYTGRLEKRNSGYSAIFYALLALAGTGPSAGESELSGNATDDPNDMAALDRAWEEAEVRFGPGDAQGSGCSRASEILAKMEPKRGRAAIDREA